MNSSPSVLKLRRAKKVAALRKRQRKGSSKPNCSTSFKRVTGFRGEAPLVEVLYRQGQLLDLRGEKLSEDVLYSALRAAVDTVFDGSNQRQALTGLEDYAAIPSVLDPETNGMAQNFEPAVEVATENKSVWADLSRWRSVGSRKYSKPSKSQDHNFSMLPPGTNGAPRYVVYVELKNDPQATEARERHALESVMTALSNALDTELAARNFAYSSFRKKAAVGQPEVRLVESGSFVKLRGALVKNGSMSANQLKVPRVLKNVEHVSLLQEKTLR